MINQEDEYAFNEQKARNLVDYLLKNDTSMFKKLIPEIRAMDSKSFENLFKGTPFKSPENQKGYDYRVNHEIQFEKLLDKFENFSFILDEWYLDEKYYEYLKKLWINYISIENLQKKDEKGRELLLNSYEIDYENWPENIKSDFKKAIRATKKTRIFDPKKVGEVEEASSEFKKLLKKMKIFKKAIEAEPEMEIYENNTNIFINKLKKIINVIQKIGKKWNCGKAGIITPILGSIPIIIPFLGLSDLNDQTNKTYNFNLDDSLNDEDEYENDYESSDNLNLEQQAKAIFENNLFFFIYAGLSFIHLGWSVYTFYQAYNDIKKIKNNKKDYEDRLEAIKKKFVEHKEKIGILPDDFKKSLKIIGEVFRDLCEDYNNLEILIHEINESIKIANKYKNKSTLGLIGSGILGITGIVGGFIIRNPNSFWYGISTISHTLTAIGHTATIIESNEIVKELNDIEQKAIKQKDEIKTEIDNLIKIISDMEKGQLPKFEEKFTI